MVFAKFKPSDVFYAQSFACLRLGSVAEQTIVVLSFKLKFWTRIVVKNAGRTNWPELEFHPVFFQLFGSVLVECAKSVQLLVVGYYSSAEFVYLWEGG